MNPGKVLFMTDSLIATLARPGVLVCLHPRLSNEAGARMLDGVTDDRAGQQRELVPGASALPCARPWLVEAAGQLSRRHYPALRQAIAARMEIEETAQVRQRPRKTTKHSSVESARARRFVVTQRPVFGLHEIYPKMMETVQLLELTPELASTTTPGGCAAMARAPKIACSTRSTGPHDGRGAVRARA